MLIALLSDIHDHTTHLLQALLAARERGCERLFFMGDMAEMTTFRTLREEWPGELDLVFGNNEFERAAFLRAADQWQHTTLHGDCADISLDGRRIFFTHYPGVASGAAGSGLYDAVFFGHTHTPEMLISGKTLLANPGEVYGRQGRPSIGIYDTVPNTVRFIYI